MIHNVDPQLNQWDVGRSVNVSDSNATHIHFANQGDSKAVIIEIVGGSAKIPDYLLQTGKTLLAYAVLDGVTLETKSFPVRKRERPENYVYEDDQRNYIYELIADAMAATEAANLAADNASDATVNAEAATASATEAAENANLATKSANEAAHIAKNFMVVGDANGTNISLYDSAKQFLVGLRIFGKTTQDGTPTPDAPVDLVSVGDSGSIAVNVTGSYDAQSMTISMPKGLPGVPVDSGGNYTDANGQQWICDEVDLARGVYVQRVYKKVFTGNEDFAKSGQPGNYYLWKDTMARPNDGNLALTGSLCNRLVERVPDRLWDTVGDGFAISTVSPFCVHFRIEAISTVDALKTQLSDWYNSGNPLEIVFELATPIETPLSAEELAAYAELHTYRNNTTISNDASAYMELEYVMDAKKYIDNLVGSGGSGGAAPARLADVTLRASAWKGSNSLYSQVVTIDGVTEYSKVDLLPSVEQLAIFHDKDVAFVTENEDGVVTVYAIGDKPTNDYTMQVSITEVVV